MRSEHPIPLSRLPVVLLAAVAIALGGAPAAGQAAAQPTGRLLVTLDSQGSNATMRAAIASLETLAGLRRDGAQVPQIGLVSVRPASGRARTARGRWG